MRIEQISPVGLPGVNGITMAGISDGASAARVKIDIATLQPGSSLPKHPAWCEQIFYVISGHGRVAGDDDIEHPISAGWAAIWDAGEQHTSWADSVMTVLIVQRQSETT